MSRLQRRFVNCVTLVLVCTLLAVLFTAYYKQPMYESIKGSILKYRTFQTNNNSLKDINIIRGKYAILNKKSRDVTVAPEMRLHKLCNQLNTIDRSKITSSEYSKLAFVTVNNDGAVIVLIHTYDMLNRPNTRGDDVIVIWAMEKDGDGCVSGEVIDHKNGTYTGILRLFWSGPTSIKAKLASSIINTCLKMKAIKKYGNAVFALKQGYGIRGKFKNENRKEITKCGANPKIFGHINICNLTSINGGMPWYCGKPKTKSLSCSDIRSFGTGEFNTKWASQQEKIQNPGHGVFRSTVDINVPLPSRLMSEVPCKDSLSNISWENEVPSGYWLEETWHMTQCKSEIKQTFADYRKCLNGKTILIIGDSTLRQYANYILRHIMEVDSLFEQTHIGMYHDLNNIYRAHGITLTYLKHEMPFHNPALPSSAIQSTPQLLDAFAAANISDLVVVVNYNSHYTAYPPYVLRHCHRELSKALKRLSIANPSARLFVKKPHLVIDDLRWFDPHIQLLGAEILREEFSDVHDKVVLLDCWAISVAHDSELLHPDGEALHSQMHQLLSYIC